MKLPQLLLVVAISLLIVCCDQSRQNGKPPVKKPEKPETPAKPVSPDKPTPPAKPKTPGQTAVIAKRPIQIMANINADEVRLGEKIVGAKGEIAPGKYRLIAKKQGYATIEREVVIESAGTPYVVELQFRPAPRLIYLSFISALDDKQLQPQAWLNKRAYSPGIALIPGKYQLKAELAGYQPISASIVVDVAAEAFRKQFKLTKLGRPLCAVDYEITARFPGPRAEKITPDKIYLDGKALTSGQKLIPGTYTLLVEKAGYQKISRSVTIPEAENFIIDQELLPAARQLEFKIATDYPPGATLMPDKVVIDGQLYSGKVAPGSHQIEVYKAGYPPIKEQIFVDIGTGAQIFRRLMRVLPRSLKITCVDKDSGRPIAASQVEINGKKIAGEIALKPGRHMLRVTADNFKPYSDLIEIQPGDEAHQIKIALKAVVPEKKIPEKPAKPEIKPTPPAKDQPRTVNFVFNVEPDKVLINHKPLHGRQSQLLPGKHQLVVEKRGHHTINEKITVPAGAGPYQKTITLVALAPAAEKCTVMIEVTSRFPGSGSQTLRPDVVKLNDIKIDSGAQVAPGKYRLTIRHEGYQSIEKSLTIPSGAAHFKIKEEMAAAPRKMLFRITADYPPAASITPDKVIVDGNPYSGKIAIGTHAIEIYKSGYRPIKEQILVDLGTGPYTFLRFMRVLPRSLHLSVVDAGSGKAIADARVEIDGQQVDISQEISVTPGEHMLKVTAKQYRDYLDSLKVDPGEKPQSKKIELSK